MDQKYDLDVIKQQEVDLDKELKTIHQVLLLLESRLDEQESRINGLAALMQQQVKDVKVILEGYEVLSKAIKGHHELIQSIAMSLPARKTPSTLQ
jgi:hypothetical protein